jgi:ferrous iron transport protein A
MMMPLGLLSAGETAEVLEVRGTDRTHSCCLKMSDVKHSGTACRIEDLGLRSGKMIEMLNNEGGGALLVKIDETRIAMGRGMAMKVMVRRK